MNTITTNGTTPALFVNTIVFNNGEKVDINKNDIVVFVGPNNSGKSQSLKDIYACINNQHRKVVINDVSLTFQNSDNDLAFIERCSAHSKNPSSGYIYSGMNYYIYPYHLENNRLVSAHLQDLSNFFINELKTDNRLSIVYPPNILNENESPTHPIHSVKAFPPIRERLSKFFHKAFGKSLIPGFDSMNIPLYIGDPIKIEDTYDDEQVRQEEYKRRLQQLPVLHEQGDGMRSSTGILLHLLLPNYSCFLIDEPESFLHPPQARILGQIFSEALSDDKQVFISTHSQEFLKGLISSCPNRVKIIRITRNDNTNNIKLLDNGQLNDIWKDSLLRYSNIIDSVFHESTIVCESDSDCKLYSIILDCIKAEEGKPNSTLFIHCGGKQRLPMVATALKTLGVNFRIIPDLDILNDSNLIKLLYEICGGQWSTIEKKYNVIADGARSLDKPTSIKEQRERIEEILSEFEKDGIKDLNKKQLDKLKKSIFEHKGWSMIKKSGIRALPNGDAQEAIDSLNTALQQAGIHIPLVGELENFIPKVGGHGPSWVEDVLDKYPDLNDGVYEDVKQFIKTMNI